MALEQFLLPGEEVCYESPGEVRRGRKSYALYLTGARLLLHAGPGHFGGSESVVAESLADLHSLEYTEGGLLTERGRLKINFRHETVELSGDAEVLKEVWQHLQPYAPGAAAFPFDEDATVVALPEPLFDDQPYPPARVEPIVTAPSPPRAHESRGWRLTLLLGVLLVAALAAVAAVKLRRGPATTDNAVAQPAAPASPTPQALLIMDEVFTLEPGAHRAFKFTIPSDASAANLSGGFRVTAGSYVDFYVMTEAQYDRFAAGGPPDVTSAVYRKDQWNVRVGERLSAGDYYLVFDNREGSDGPQTVAGEFALVSE